MVAKNPFDMLNGKGQNRIMVKTPNPSLLITWPKATNRWSLPTSR